MTRPAPILSCICGHQQPSHPDNGACQEPSGRCQCQTYAELCPKCAHAKTDHNTDLQQCSRTIKTTQLPCGCIYYTPPT